MANNTTILEVIARINNAELDAETKERATKEVLNNPDRADAILSIFMDIEAEEADMAAYCDGNGIEDNRRRELEKRANEEKARKQAEEADNRKRNAALVNIMKADNKLIYGTPEFNAAWEAEYRKLKEGKRVCFTEDGGAFTYDMSKNNLTEKEREALEAEERDAQTSDEVITEYMTALPDGPHHFNVVSTREYNDRNSGLLRQTLTLEDAATGYPAYLSWLIDKDVSTADYSKTRRASLMKYNRENGNCFSGMTEKQAMNEIIANGIDAFTITYANAGKMGDRKLPSVILTEADFTYRLSKLTNSTLLKAEEEMRKHETKAETWKF